MHANGAPTSRSKTSRSKILDRTGVMAASTAPPRGRARRPSCALYLSVVVLYLFFFLQHSATALQLPSNRLGHGRPLSLTPGYGRWGALTPRSAGPAAGGDSTDTIAGLREVADQYDAFVVDQWGVLFDAEAPYEGVREALQALRDAGKLVVLLSNSSKRRSNALKNLITKMDFGEPGLPSDGALYLDVITSGECGFDLVEAGAHPTFRPGTSVLCCGRYGP